MTPRGIRNNNPGNIDYSPNVTWFGQLPYDATVEPRFCRFESPECGLRALMKLLRNYQKLHGLNTIKDIISRYAPSGENDTNSYINFVSEKLGVTPAECISTDDRKTVFALVDGIVRMENGGQQPYSDEQLLKAFSMLG